MMHPLPPPPLPNYGVMKFQDDMRSIEVAVGHAVNAMPTMTYNWLGMASDAWRNLASIYRGRLDEAFTDAQNGARNAEDIPR